MHQMILDHRLLSEKRHRLGVKFNPTHALTAGNERGSKKTLIVAFGTSNVANSSFL